jgi:hypothetical protein
MGIRIGAKNLQAIKSNEFIDYIKDMHLERKVLKLDLEISMHKCCKGTITLT